MQVQINTDRNIDGAATVEDALEGAAGKMQRSLETTLGRLANR